MSRNFGTIKTNIGNNVQDTSAAFATIIGTYVNNRYFDILRRFNVQVIVDPYNIAVTAGTNEYVLASTFGKELFVQDTTNKSQYSYMPLQTWIDTYKTDPTSSGIPDSYTIIDYMDTATPPARQKKIRLFPTPSGDATLNVPYIVRPVELSATTDNTIIDCEVALELGATADAWRYKRQNSKANDYEMLYEKSIATLIWDRENQPAQIHLFTPNTFNPDDLI